MLSKILKMGKRKDYFKKIEPLNSFFLSLFLHNRYEEFEYLRLQKLLHHIKEKKCEEIIAGWSESEVLR